MSATPRAGDHGDLLIVSGGGSTAVAVDELFVDAARLGASVAVIEEWVARAGVIHRGLEPLGLDDSMLRRDAAAPAGAVRLAGVHLDQASDRASRLRTSLLEAAERYGATERFVDGLWQLAAFAVAPWLGFHAPALIGGGLLAASGAAAWRAFGGGATPLEAWLADHKDLLSDPAFVRLVRLAADHADEVAAGVLHVPMPPWAAAAIGAPESASLLLGAMGMLGVTGSRVLVDGPVRVERFVPPVAGPTNGPPLGHPAEACARHSDVVAPPAGFGELADRIPAGGDGEPQIRIERYGGAEDSRWIVYVGGTVTFDVDARWQPADMTSNTHGIADDTALDALRLTGAESAALEQAVRTAMDDAGVRPGDPLLAVGYSGGGIVAAQLAADPELHAVGAVNLGGPVASAPTRDGVGILSIEHEEDIAPATGGSGHPSPDRVTVSRSVLEPGQEYDAAFPAHELQRYRQTAALIDESEEERLASFRSLIGEVTGSGAGLRTDWVARRDLSPSPTDER